MGEARAVGVVPLLRGTAAVSRRSDECECHKHLLGRAHWAFVRLSILPCIDLKITGRPIELYPRGGGGYPGLYVDFKVPLRASCLGEGSTLNTRK